MPYATFSEAVDAIIAAINDLQGPDNRTLTDIWNKLDASGDNTQVEAKLDELKAYWEILLKTGVEPGYYNLFEIAGVPLSDTEEAIEYPPTLGGILKKLQNIQGAPLTSREGELNQRTKLKTIYDALSAPPPAGTDDPINWWQEVKDIIDLIGTGVDITTDLYDFLSRTANTAANAATTGTTGATAIGQWVTAMALALIAAQMNQAQNTRITIRNNTNLLPTIETNTSNLPDIELHLSAIGAHMDDLLADDSVSGKTNLYNLLQNLECICRNTRRQLVIQDAPPPDDPIDEPINLATEPPADADKWCQRVQWFISRIAFIIGSLDKQIVTAGLVAKLYQDELDTYLSKSDAQAIANIAERTIAQNERLVGADGFRGIGLWIDDNTAALVESIYSAPNPDGARYRFDEATQTPTLTDNEEMLIRSFVTNRILNSLFNEEIPLEPFELTFFDSSDCGDLPAPPVANIPPSERLVGDVRYRLLIENREDDEFIIVREGWFGSFPLSAAERQDWGLTDSHTAKSSDESTIFQGGGGENVNYQQILLYNISGFEVFLYPVPGESEMRAPVYIIEDIGGPNETLHLIPEDDATVDPDAKDEGWFCNVTTTAFVFWSTEAFEVTIYAPPGKV